MKLEFFYPRAIQWCSGQPPRQAPSSETTTTHPSFDRTDWSLVFFINSVSVIKFAMSDGNKRDKCRSSGVVGTFGLSDRTLDTTDPVSAQCFRDSCAAHSETFCLVMT